MGEPVISVEKVGKRYRIGGVATTTCSSERLQRIAARAAPGDCAARGIASH